MKQVLVIDDEDGIREIIQISLETATPWQVITAASGKEGYALAIATPPDVILLDVMMPEMGGVETFQKLQDHDNTRYIPTIFLTAKANSPEHQKFTNLGITGVIAKPFKAQMLVAQMRSILGWAADW
jgi:CheY-like chemotaxis protein